MWALFAVRCKQTSSVRHRKAEALGFQLRKPYPLNLGPWVSSYKLIHGVNNCCISLGGKFKLNKGGFHPVVKKQILALLVRILRDFQRGEM